VSDSYRKADKTFRFKVEVSELIITYEAQDFETLLYRLAQVMKDYKTFASNKIYQRDFALLELLEDMANSKNAKRDENIQKKIKALLKFKADEAIEDSEMIKYKDWLNKKLSS
jgi:hypothetical protein